MAMTGAGLSAARKAAVDGVALSQTSDPAAAASYRDAVLLADSNAIVTYIQTNARCSGVDVGTYGGDTHDNVQIV